MLRVSAILAPVAALAMAAPASAATTVWTYAGSGAGVSNNAANITASDGVKVQITAWTSTKTSGSYFSGSSGHQRATLGLWDYGLGAQKGSSDYHTIDNTGSYDYILLQFDTAVVLDLVVFTSGWDGKDSDASIAHANVDYASYGGTYKTLSNSFWSTSTTNQLNTLTHSNTPNNTFANGINISTRQVNPMYTPGNVWLIAAKIGSNDNFKDGFKVAGFTYSIPHSPGVPEPSTWAMLILGMGVVGGAMRRRTRVRLALA